MKVQGMCVLYRVFRKGFNKKSARCDKESLKGNFSQWLAWIHPQLFPRGKIWCECDSAFFFYEHFIFTFGVLV